MTIDTDIGKHPISDDLPAGTDIRDSTEFEQIQSEIDKLSAISGSGAVDWVLITSLCETIIASKSKDMLIGCYLTGGLLETQGLVGLAGGLRILSNMLQTHWDSLFPTTKRMRARRNALQWLIDRISQKSDESSWQEKPADGKLIDTILETLRNIDATLSEKDEDAPSIQPLLSIFGGFPRIEEQTEPPASNASATGASAATDTAQSTAMAFQFRGQIFAKCQPRTSQHAS
jgi:type VI secretion system protein VasJ